MLLSSPTSLSNKNLYAYCDNNPVTREDEDGEAWHIAIGAAVGAVAGLVGQIISDGITSAMNGKLTVSNWQTYTGAILGGAAGGVVLAATGNVNLSNTVTGAVTTGAGLTLEKRTDKVKEWNCF